MSTLSVMLKHRRPLKLRHAFILVLCIPIICIYLLSLRQQSLKSLTLAGPRCIGWRATKGCIPYGPRLRNDDKSCLDEVLGTSGYCVCEGNITVARMSCGPHRFRCLDKCAELEYNTSGALALPSPLVCRPGDSFDIARLAAAWAVAAAAAGASASTAAGLASAAAAAAETMKANASQSIPALTGLTAQQDSLGDGDAGGGRRSLAAAGAAGGLEASSSCSSGPRVSAVQGHDTASLAQASSRVWDIVDDLVGRHDPGDVRLPGPRTYRVDWVMEGRRIAPREVDKLTDKVSALLRDLPPYPDGGVAVGEAAHGTPADSPARVSVFSGRGVVMVGGGVRYLTPAWTNLHVLRRSGCTLPVELWFPLEEFPNPAVEEALEALGVTARRLAARELQRGYGVKVAALLLSRFREVLFLDSDNAVLRDPSFLFDSPPYIETGALLWPDYWDRTAAKEVSRILNISPARLPSGTFESGQMVIDKARHWRGLLVAAYMNVYGSIFSDLLSCYVGKGDKETFAYGLLTAGEDMWVSPVPPGSAGVEAVVCSPPGRAARCREQYLGNTMVQHSPDGSPLFFHANYHKWDLALPDSFETGWNRRWRVLQPGRRSVAPVVYGNATFGSGYDIERYVYDVLRAFRCAPFFDKYIAARVRMGEAPLAAAPLDSFHALPDYITFRDFYSRGWTGSFSALTYPPLTLRDHLVAWYFGKPRWWIRPWERKIKRLRKKLLPPWLGGRKRRE